MSGALLILYIADLQAVIDSEMIVFANFLFLLSRVKELLLTINLALARFGCFGRTGVLSLSESRHEDQ